MVGTMQGVSPGQPLCRVSVRRAQKEWMLCMHAYKQQLCGRCDLSLAELHSQGRAPANHDCEGGPDGYGAEHLDLYGDKWHRIWVKWRDGLPPCEAPADPLVTARNATLQIAKSCPETKSQDGQEKNTAPCPRRRGVQCGESHPSSKETTAGRAAPESGSSMTQLKGGSANW